MGLTGAWRLGGTLGPVTATLAAAAAYALLRPASEETVVPALAAAAALGAVVWALADLERFVLVPLLSAMIAPAALLEAGGALVAAADLLLLVALGAWLARAALGNAPAVRLEPVVAAGLVFAGVTASSIAWTTDASATTKAAVQILEIAFVVPAVFASIPFALARIREGLMAYVAVTAVLATVVGVLFQARALGGDISPQYLAGLHKNATGSFLGVGLVIAFTLSLERGRPARTRRLLLLAALVELAGLVATISRGALVGAFVGVLVSTVLLRRARVRTLLLGLAVAGAFLVTIQAELSERAREAGGSDTNVVRLHSYANAVERIRAEPVLGTGAGTYWDEIPELGIGLADPNNLFLLTWAELGLAGLAALLLVLARYGRVLAVARRQPEEGRVLAVAAGTAALSLLVHFQFDSSWTRGTATICFALIGLAVAAVRLSRTPQAAPEVSTTNTVAAQQKSLRVLHVVSSATFAGIERHVLRLAGRLRALGIDSSIACPPGAVRLREEAAAAGVPVVVARPAELPQKLAGRFPDVVHAHDGAAAVAAWRVSTFGGSKLVRTQHFVRPASVERTGWRRAASLALHRALNAEVDALVAVSESVASAIRERREARAARIEVISPGIDVPEDAEVRRAARARRESEHLVIATVGRLEREKAHDLLLLAMPLLLERVPDARLVVAGSGSLEEDLRRLAGRLRLERAIVWAGEVDDPAEVLRSAHVYVNPSSVEGFGLAVAEAMAWALPIVGMRGGGVAELVEDGLTGLLVDDADPSALAAALARLAADRSLAQRLGRAGRARAVELLDADVTAARTAALYERLREDEP